ncbi:MAG: hypothetical protein CL676_00655 [Bdellovibrionaceae bacterium]|nr:hypothetical protein [Pseudobdellovibrionaceae bacterium]|tara:strand:+ start:1665 stop:2240 length:576 start_codon:yes stop_codon:yes gene_type:complete
MDQHSQSALSQLHENLQNLASRNQLLKRLEKRLSELFRITPQELRYVGLALLLASMVLVILRWTSSPETPREAPPIEVSTFIPKDHVLIPIVPKNFETLDSILGPFGRADLYVGRNQPSRQALARNVKILRAPKNPSVFAVLVHQDRSPEILEANEKGLYVVVKNKSADGTHFEDKASAKKKSRIIYTENL